MMVIGVHGKAGVGKDTFADFLVEKYGYVKRGFAMPLYEEVAAAFRTDIERLRDRARKEEPSYVFSLTQSSDYEFIAGMKELGHDVFVPRSPRQVLQLWGTEYRRRQNPRYWIEKMEAFLNTAIAPGVVAPDCRFLNEAICVRENGGCVVQILREVPGVSQHESEKPLPEEMIDFKVYNRSGGLDGLREAAEYLPMWLAATGPAARNGAEPTVWRC